MTIKYEIEERTAPREVLVKVIHVESKTFSVFNIEQWSHGLRRFAEDLSDLQEMLAHADFSDMRKAYDEYRRGRSTSFRVIGIAVADLVHAIDVHPGAQQVTIELPPIEDVWHRKTYQNGGARVEAPDGTLYEPSKYITSEAGDRLAKQLMGVGEDLQNILSGSNWGRQLLEINTKAERVYGVDTATGKVAEINGAGQVVLGDRGIGLTESQVKDITGKAEIKYADGGWIKPHDKEEDWELFSYNEKSNTINVNAGLIENMNIEWFYSALDRIDQQVSLSHGMRSTQPKSQAAKNAKNPRYWAHRAEDRVNGILVQAKANLPSDDPTRQLIEAVSEMFSDHIHGLGE